MAEGPKRFAFAGFNLQDAESVRELAWTMDSFYEGENDWARNINSEERMKTIEKLVNGNADNPLFEEVLLLLSDVHIEAHKDDKVMVAVGEVLAKFLVDAPEDPNGSEYEKAVERWIDFKLQSPLNSLDINLDDRRDASVASYVVLADKLLHTRADRLEWIYETSGRLNICPTTLQPAPVPALPRLCPWSKTEARALAKQHLSATDQNTQSNVKECRKERKFYPASRFWNMKDTEWGNLSYKNCKVCMIGGIKAAREAGYVIYPLGTSFTASGDVIRTSLNRGGPRKFIPRVKVDCPEATASHSRWEEYEGFLKRIVWIGDDET